MKIIRWLDDNLEEALLIALLVMMTLLMGLQVFSRYILNASLSWSEELTRYLFIWSGFLSIS
ncbi:TRAP transporter small permease subunit, partial [[Clostridium] innocuum]|nr:TRAP transporter small permease subunit [[Clostridium] innocuum]